jgi:dipeptidyl aminopeptidase/acylaminoacyl peptidase
MTRKGFGRMTVQTAPYGSWKSPITADLIVKGTIRLEQIAVDGEDVYWTEGRPDESGRSCIVRKTPGGTQDVTPRDYNARTRVHEYGGGAFTVHNGVVYFSNFSDNQLYKVEPGGTPVRVTDEPGMRYADLRVDPFRNRLICVREDHTDPTNVKNTIAAVDLATGTSTVLVSGNDFYASPRLSPDGTKLVWQTWNHPNLPWDGNELWVAEVAEDGSLRAPVKVAGGDRESIFQPQWSPDGELYFVSDRTGWWNLYRVRDGAVEHLVDKAAEFGQPQWVFDRSTYAFLDHETLVCCYEENGRSHLAKVDLKTGELTPIPLSYTSIDGLRAAGSKVVFQAGSPTEFPAIVALDVQTGATEVLRRSSELEIDKAYLSVPQAIEFPTEDGQTVYGFYYPPANRDFVAPEGEKPPLIVASHGGPTSAFTDVLNLSIQFFTSRGFAYLTVNYGGSTGYGRAYRERLRGQWGVVDVNDCCNGARYLVKEGLADEARIAITGGSAGGYTTLAALAFTDVFKAGSSHFGLSDLELFVGDTHKFESRYLDGLIGPYPERKDLYRERSPINYTDGLSCPIIFFQGLDDKIVPPNQAEIMVDALRKKGIPVAYLAFEGEGHGFRMGANIKRTLEAELYFYSRIFGFELLEDVPPIPIENL